MWLKNCIKQLIMSNATLSDIYCRFKASKLNRELKRDYGSMSRKGIFESIYSNSTWGGY